MSTNHRLLDKAGFSRDGAERSFQEFERRVNKTYRDIFDERVPQKKDLGWDFVNGSAKDRNKNR